jgi:hypothetical protein
MFTESMKYDAVIRGHGKCGEFINSNRFQALLTDPTYEDIGDKLKKALECLSRARMAFRQVIHDYPGFQESDWHGFSLEDFLEEYFHWPKEDCKEFAGMLWEEEEFAEACKRILWS